MVRDYLFYKEEYIEKGRTALAIAKEARVSPNKIRRELQKLGFQIRNRSETQKLLLRTGKKHPTKGIPRSEKVKIAISESIANNWKSLDPIEKEYRIEGYKDRWAKMSTADKQNLQKLAAKGIRKAATDGSKLEKFVLAGLTDAGYLVQFHVSQKLENQALEVDLFLPELAIAIELDGISHVEPIWGNEVLTKKQEADKQKHGLLILHGIKLIRVIQKTKTDSSKLKRETLKEIIKNIEYLIYAQKTKTIIIEVHDDYSIRTKGQIG